MGGQRTSLAGLAAQKVETVPGRDQATLVKMLVSTIAPTPVNPRADFGSKEELVELGESMRRQQLAPVVVVSRASYLKLFPEHAEQVDAATYVLANGERRFRAAQAAGLETIEAVIREGVAQDRKTFVDAVVTENVDRKNFDPIEEALAVEALVKEFGTARAVAEHRGAGESWVSQRRSLLRLAPDMQQLVRKRVMPVEKARHLAKAIKDQGLDGEQQREWWEAELGRPKVRERQQGESPPRAEPENFTAVKPPAGEGGFSAENRKPALSPVPEPRQAETPEQLFTDPRAQEIWEQDLPVDERLNKIREVMDGGGEGVSGGDAEVVQLRQRPAVREDQAVPRTLQWDNPMSVAVWARKKMTEPHRRQLIDLLLADLN